MYNYSYLKKGINHYNCKNYVVFGLGTSKLTRHRYYSQVLYKLKQPHEWDVIFVVVKDDPAFIKVIPSLCELT